MGRMISKCYVHLGGKKTTITKKSTTNKKSSFWFYLMNRLYSGWHPGNDADEWKIPNWWHYRIMWWCSWEWGCVSYASVAIKNLYILVKRQHLLPSWTFPEGIHREFLGIGKQWICLAWKQLSPNGKHKQLKRVPPWQEKILQRCVKFVGTFQVMQGIPWWGRALHLGWR